MLECLLNSLLLALHGTGDEIPTSHSRTRGSISLATTGGSKAHAPLGEAIPVVQVEEVVLG